jgi:glutamate-5-semialdehyde dehydrogenase
MNAVDIPSLTDYCLGLARRAKTASSKLALVSTEAKNRWLLSSAEALDAQAETIIAANAKDLANAPGYGLDAAAIDRLKLDAKRIQSISDALRQVASLPDPIGEVLDGYRRPNGLEIQKVRVPLGVVFFIYESRPNVTADAAAICIKSGNAVILRGGKEALHSSSAIIRCLQSQTHQHGIPEDAVQFVETTDRNAVGQFLKLSQYIDVAIPRGGEGLIRRVTEEATMPVIKHFDGNCHIYVDRGADLPMAVRVIENAKCQRMGVCNALESLLIHVDEAERLLPPLNEVLSRYPIEIRGCARTLKILSSARAANDVDYRTEFLGPIMSCRVVDSLDEAIEHINAYGSHHTDAIMTRDLQSARRFTTAVDSSAVVVNASTRFNDGGEFGFGAEIGISTDKFHARGPCGLRELTSYKYIVHGNGHIRQ